MGKPKSHRASAVEITSVLDRPVTAEGMINQLVPTHNRTLSGILTKGGRRNIVGDQQPCVLVAAHVPAPSTRPHRHHPYSSCTRVKTEPALYTTAKKRQVSYRVTAVTTPEYADRRDLWDVPSVNLPAVVESELQEVNQIHTVELYITPNSEGSNTYSITTTNTAGGNIDFVESILDQSTTASSPAPVIDNRYDLSTSDHINHSSHLSPTAMPISASIDHDPVTAEVCRGDDEEVTTMQFVPQDDAIMNATLKALESGSLTPLIKEELRYTIQSRRFAEGKGELKVEFKTPTRKKMMTEDETGRALKRRQQNKEAAQRFRQRQKDTSDSLTAKINRLEKQSDSLVKDLTHLRQERNELQEMLVSHLQICPKHQLTNAPFNTDQFINSVFTQSDNCTDSHLLPSQSRVNTDSYSMAGSSRSGSVTMSASTCPDTSESNYSVFSPDNSGENSNSVQTTVPTYTDSELFPVDGAEFCYVDQTMPGSGSEEVIVEVVYDNGLEIVEDQLVDPFTSVDTISTLGGSYTSETPSLSNSTTDLRHNLASAYSMVHINSRGSEPFDLQFDMEQDFLLTEDVDDLP